jgi:hypothetical protein
MTPRWVLTRTSRRAHLDIGERSSQSLRVQAEHIIVTACRAHLDVKAPVVPETYQPKCSNCLRIARLADEPWSSAQAGSSESYAGFG